MSFVELFGTTVNWDDIPDTPCTIQVGVEYDAISYAHTTPNLREFVRWYTRRPRFPVYMLYPEQGHAKEDKDKEDDDREGWLRPVPHEPREFHRRFKPRKTKATKAAEQAEMNERELELRLEADDRKHSDVKYAMTTTKLDPYICSESLPRTIRDGVEISGLEDDMCCLTVGLGKLRFAVLHPGFKWKQFHFWTRFKRAFQCTVKYIIRSTPTVRWLLTEFKPISVLGITGIICDYWRSTSIGLVDLSRVRPVDLMSHNNDKWRDEQEGSQSPDGSGGGPGLYDADTDEDEDASTLTVSVAL